jgi:hypothetical protein
LTLADSFLVKLKNLERQITIARLADFSFPDAREALDILQNRLKKKWEQIEESKSFSTATRNAILRDANHLISRFTTIAGIITRSASVRNAFELYFPFLELCQRLVGADARLILSSEWQYVPFTYPQSLADLPEFIIIGLPASESDNVLIFPAAGHELGHSIWAKCALGEMLKPEMEGRVNEALRRHRPEFETTFPDAKGADLDQDMFVQYIKSAIVSSVGSQVEETFADFIGLLIFADSYLSAFEYLVAPHMMGARTKEYPDTHERATTLQRVAKQKLGIEHNGYSEAFSVDTPFRLPHDRFICSLADEVVNELQDHIFDKAQGIVTTAAIPLPNEEKLDAVHAAFSRGVPYDIDATLGDLINAGWRIFRQGESKIHAQQGRSPADYISDLVLKSAEIHEIERILR